MNRFLIVFLISLFTLPAFCQPKGYEKSNNENEIKLKLKQTSQNTNSIRSNFVQVKTMSMLDEKVTSKGKFLYKKERKVRMEYTSPFQYLLVVNGDKIQIKDRQKTNSFSSGSNKLFTSINNIIVDCMTGNVFDNKDFSSTVYTNNKFVVIQMVPLKRDLKDFFEKIYVYLDNTTYQVSKIEMIESMGDNTVITFAEKEINVTIDDAEFSIN